MKSIKDFMFSEKMEKAMNDAVDRAVAESETAGLPRSYLHSYDELPDFLAQLQQCNKATE